MDSGFVGQQEKTWIGGCVGLLSSGFENKMLILASAVAMLGIRMRAESHSEEVSVASV